MVFSSRHPHCARIADLVCGALEKARHTLHSTPRSD